MDKGKQAAGPQDMSAPRRRPGRPRMRETRQETPSEEARRTRMRLAQRSYRSRKQSALMIAKARAEVLEVALDGSIDEFIKFYEHVSQTWDELPAGLMTQLNQTAMNIVSIAKKARLERSMLVSDHTQGLDEDAAEAAAESDAGHEPASQRTCNTADETQTRITAIQPPNRPYEPFTSGKPAPVSQRLMLACLTRAISLLQLENFPVAALNPAMLLPLQLERAERLLERVARRLSGSPSAFSADCQYSDGRNADLPKMMRLIEGNLNTLTPRSSPPNLQSLQFGRTRTMLHTAISELQGEWLEAPDVEEYLEQRGIFVRMGSPYDVINLSTLAHDDDPLPRPPAPNPPEGHIAHGGTPRTRAPLPEHDFTIFGELFFDGQTIPTGHNNVSLSDWNPEMRILANNAVSSQQAHESLKITIDIDKLIRGLADTAVCLGPCPGIRRIHVDEAIRGSVSNLQ
ncbi:hypothetical protein J3F83DRAFT_756910 [Trichoderma novae-zelandiae]